MNTTKKLFGFIFITLTLVVLGGCTKSYVSTKIVEPYSIQNKIDLVAQLDISEELKNAQIKDDFGLDILVIQVGENLVKNINHATKAVFSHVITNDAPNVNSVSPDIILQPRLVLAKASWAQWKWDTNTIALAIEWTVLDKNGNPIWVDTVEGEGSSGASVDDYVIVALDMAVEEVSHKSYNMLANSPVIQKLQDK